MSAYTAVLDSSAVLDVVYQEAGMHVVNAALRSRGAVMSAVNFAEVLSVVSRQGRPAAPVALLLKALGVTVLPFEEQDCERTVQLHDPALNLSLGDRVCLVLAERLGVPVLTADLEWSRAPTTAQVIQVRTTRAGP